MKIEGVELLVWLEKWKNASCEKLILEDADSEKSLKRYREGEEAYDKVRQIIKEHS